MGVPLRINMEKVRPHDLAKHCQRTPAHIYVQLEPRFQNVDMKQKARVRVVKKEFIELLRALPNTIKIEVLVGLDAITVKF